MNVFEMFLTVVKSFVSVLKMLLPLTVPVFLIILIVFVNFVLNLLYLRVIKRMKRKPQMQKILEEDGTITEIPYKFVNKKPSIFKRLFVMLPKQLALDCMSRDLNEFQEFGINLFCGRQGSGKTMTTVYLMNLWRNKYPNLKILTNFAYKYEDEELRHWKQLVTTFNGKEGVVYGIDELHTWLSMKSNAVPFELLKEISTQRKQKSCILGTCQVFGKVPKEIRDQTEWIYLPRTFLNCLTIVRRARAEDYDSDKNKFKRYHGTFFFVHTQELRESYDTFRRIEQLIDEEFEKNEFLTAEG